ncbi:MAG: lysophospholipase [Treponema sp.]|jgi:alpha-beta hydrolase superfamily lysophospholipase|nr:lysophospholipase [Treponema sp.]
MVQNETLFEISDGTKLFLYRWIPKSQPKAVLHIVHGMAEYALRYRRLAEKLTQAGIEVWAADQRGHGKTADLSVNKPGKGGLLGHCIDTKGFSVVTKDIYAINKEIKKTINAPLFLLGHSWGSFIAQNYIEEYTGSEAEDSPHPKLSGCILSGTKGPGDFMVKIGKPFLTVLAFFRGQRKSSKLAWSMADAQYSKPFTPNRTPFDWLSRDTEEVDKYIADPLCGFLCSSGFYRDLTRILCKVHTPKQMKKINRHLPMYVFSGSADPVGDMGVSATALVNEYRNLGIKDLEFVLYPGARHETLNETNREEVMENLLSWINRHCEI